MNTSVLWVAPPETPRTDTWLNRVRSGGLLPVRVDSCDAALGVMRQFRAGLVVVQTPAEKGAGECERLVKTGSPVVAVIDDARYAQIYLSVGCAAAVGEKCPAGVFVEILQRVAAGQRNIVWPEVVGAVPESIAG
jgi:hypothetical protein